jgi:hypothetical protein
MEKKFKTMTEQIQEYGDLVNLMQNVSFKGVDYAFLNCNKFCFKFLLLINF